MSYRSSFGSGYASGRGSPYVPPRLSQQNRSLSELFEYVDAGQVEPQTYKKYAADAPFEEDDAPDVIHIKYMGQAFKLEFPPYSISESGVTVEEVRKRIAEGLQQDPRRVRLVYKDHELKYDPYPVKKYGLKQNSEIAVVISEQLNNYGEQDYPQSSGEDSGSGSSLKPPKEQRPRGLSTVRHRSGHADHPKSSGYLHPNGHVHDHDRIEKRRSNSSVRSAEKKPSVYQSAEKVPGTQKPSVSSSQTYPTPTSAPRNVAPADPDSPMGKVQALQGQYYDKWLPECQKFLNAPPSDPTQRDREYRRISESVMKHIIEAADAIELQGDQDARAERKRVLGDAQELLRRLDAVPKQK